MNKRGDIVCSLMLLISMIYFGHYAMAGLAFGIGWLVNMMQRKL